jgi:polyvinyl alcohol dehydrogenase (cytochrome)
MLRGEGAPRVRAEMIVDKLFSGCDLLAPGSATMTTSLAVPMAKRLRSRLWPLAAQLIVICGCSDNTTLVTPTPDAGPDAPRGSLDCADDGVDWPFYGGNVCNTRAARGSAGITPATAPKLGVKWTTELNGDVSATPAVVGGQVYVPDMAGMLNRIDAATGRVVWSKYVGDLAGISPPDGGTGDGGIPADPIVARGTPVVAGGAIIFGLANRSFSGVVEPLAYMVAVDQDSGALRWKTLVDPHRAARVTAPAVLEGGKIYVGVSSYEESLSINAGYQCTFRGSVVALDAATGAILWKTPMIDDGTYFREDGVTPAGYAGAAIWSGAPTVDRKRRALYVTTSNNYAVPDGTTDLPAGDHVEAIVALDLDSGAVRWSSRMTDGDVWTYALFIAGDPRTGPDWDFGAGANLFNARIAGQARDLVGAGQKSGIYWAVDADTGAVVWKTEVGPGGHLGGIHWGTAVDDDRVYVGVNNESGTPYSLGGTGAMAGQETNVGSWAALDLSSGDIVWQVPNKAMSAPLGGASVNGPPSAVNGVVFGGSMDAEGTMFAFDATTGAVLWSFVSGGTVYSGPAIAGNVVYWGCGFPSSRLGFGTPCRKIYAFEVKP